MTPQALAAASAASRTHDTLIAACGSSEPGTACRLVWDLTHSGTATRLTRVYLAGPVTVALRIAFVLLLAFVIRALAHRILRRMTDRAANGGKDGSGHALLPELTGERRRQRSQALRTILGNASSILIFGIAAIIIMGDLGINLAPILASAGVLGVALGFGAQNLVGDFLAGVSILLEDQYGVGDVITTSATTGTVEAVGLRVTRMRDVNGVVWHIRNGSIQQVGNQSQGWARAVIDFPVPYQQDMSEIRQIMTQVATAMWREPRWEGVILEEPKVWGVQSLSSSEAVWRLVAMTTPPRQYEVERELRERIKVELDSRGIATAPTVFTLTGPDAHGGATLAAAAGQAADAGKHGDSEFGDGGG
ncbi:MAG TPA: mechanosensitive ion channel family protein [Streptosporangiaceae bacterium]|jgi:small-conductance mechanosensitive channel|nr:mechanosensitive ion channel family protein [Streptosporangiaceae bacterium]